MRTISCNLGRLLAVLLSALVALLTAGTQTAGAHEQPGFQHFVTRDGDRLMDGGHEYRFLSAATPTLQLVEDNYPFANRPDFEWRWPDAFEIRDTLETIRQMGGQATRIYCLSVKRSLDRPGTPRHIVAPASRPDGSINPAAFNEQGFRVLDRILATANEKGVRVVIPITNEYPWHGGYEDLAALRGLPSRRSGPTRGCAPTTGRSSPTCSTAATRSPASATRTTRPCSRGAMATSSTARRTRGSARWAG